MIDQKKYEELLKLWGEHGYVYSTEKCVMHRIKHFEKVCCPHLTGKNVLELACNSGIFGYVISQYSGLYTGVEPGNLIKSEKHSDINYFEQLKHTHKLMPSDRSFIINSTVAEFCRSVQPIYDALVVNFALYHFSDAEIKGIEDVVLPNCDTVCIQNRSKEREIKRNSHDFWKAKNIVRWLEKNEFKCEVVWGDKKKSFSEIVGKK